jgi:hypothetical protein
VHQPQTSSNIFDLPLDQPDFQHLAPIDMPENDDPFLSPNKSYLMPQIDKIMHTEKKTPIKRIASKPKTFAELTHFTTEQEELEEFRLEIKQKLLQKLE